MRTLTDVTKRSMLRAARLDLWSVALAALLAGCGGESVSKTETPPAPNGEKDADRKVALPPLPEPQFESGTCRVDSEPPGMRVFVDGRPVTDSDGVPVVTPCRVTAEAGLHAVTLAGEGYQDFSRQVRFAPAEEFQLVASVQTGESESLQQPLLGLPAGQPLPLASLNSPGNEFDPFVAADGLSIWFAADRKEGRGIYVATRSGPYGMFGKPQLIRLTRGSVQPASPSVTADALSIVYTLRGNARIWGLTRSNPLQPFSERIPLHFSSEAGETWPTCQITGDGSRIYYQREQGEEVDTRVVLRNATTDAYSRVLIVDMPGGLPCIASDGLRQYIYDGEQLLRARRATIREPFREPEPVVDLELPNFVAAPGFRQFFVTDDEQWMFYVDDPATSGDLYVVRLSDQPGWGLPLLGEAVQALEKPAAEKAADHASLTMQAEPNPEQQPAAPGPTDDRLPYTRFVEQFRSLVRQQKLPEARMLLDGAAADPALAGAEKLLNQDREDLEALREFRSDLTQAVASLQPGDEIPLGTYRFEVVEASQEALTLKARTREVVRKIADLDPPEMASLVEETLSEGDSAAKFRLAVFAMYMPGFPQRTRERYAQRAGDAGARLREQHAARLLQQVEWELDRQRTTAAVKLLDDLSREFAETEAARRGSEVRGSLYTRVEWSRRGRREWKTGPAGEFTATDERADGSLLVSPQQYSRFELTMEYRTNTSMGQGGVFFRYPGRGRPYDNAFKIQLSNDRGVAADPYSTGALFSYEAPTKNLAGPQGEWNDFRMTVEGSRVTVEINGERVLRTTASDPDIPKSGYVALDGITGGISYRKILITDLSHGGD